MAAIDPVAGSAGPLDQSLERARAELACLDGACETVFQFKGLALNVHLSGDRSAGRTLHLDADLGLLPYSIESASARDHAIASFFKAKRAAPPGSQFAIEGPGRVRWTARARLPDGADSAEVYQLLALMLLGVGDPLTELAAHLR